MEYLLPLFLMIISCLIIWRSADGFEVASDYLGRKLPIGIKGATLNAIASSMPEFLTTMFFLFYLSDNTIGFSGGIGVTSGSALFNLLIIPSLVVIILYAAGKRVNIVLNRRVMVREGLVLLISQLVFVIFLTGGLIRGVHGLTMILIYFLYLLLLFIIVKRKKQKDPGFETPVDRYKHPLWLKMLTLNITHFILRGNHINRKRAWILLLVSTGIMTFGTWLLVYATDLFGEVTGIPLLFVAVVLSAVATSIPDTLISIKDARKGNYDDAMSNALGSNIFDIAFALGAPIFLYSLIHGKELILDPDQLRLIKEMWIFLLLSTVAGVSILLVGKYFNRLKAILLLSLYILFMFFIGSQANVENFPPGEKISEFLIGIADWFGTLFIR